MSSIRSNIAAFILCLFLTGCGGTYELHKPVLEPTPTPTPRPVVAPEIACSYSCPWNNGSKRQIDQTATACTETGTPIATTDIPLVYQSHLPASGDCPCTYDATYDTTYQILLTCYLPYRPI